MRTKPDYYRNYMYDFSEYMSKYHNIVMNILNEMDDCYYLEDSSIPLPFHIEHYNK